MMKLVFGCLALAACVAPMEASEPGGGSNGSDGSDVATWATVGQTRSATAVSLALPPRMQWEANDGYCGELSFVIAGLYYGQYVSQYDARALATPGVAQNTAASQLLLDDNEAAAATAMHLTYEVWPKTGTPDDFLAWMKQHLVANHPVVLGVFENTKVFGFTAEAGDDYDHIIPVVGYASSHPITDAQTYADDHLLFTDNGDYAQSVAGASQVAFDYARRSLVFDRAHEPAGQPYYIDDGEDSAIALTGISDPDGETVPVQLTLATDRELPEMVDGASARPAARPVTLAITVSGLTVGERYTLYKYTSFATVPASGFAAHAADAAAATTITATASTYTTTETIMSNEIAIYRAVTAAGD